MQHNEIDVNDQQSAQNANNGQPGSFRRKRIRVASVARLKCPSFQPGLKYNYSTNIPFQTSIIKRTSHLNISVG